MGRPKKIVEAQAPAPAEQTTQAVASKPKGRPRKVTVAPEVNPVSTQGQDLVDALVRAINLTKPEVKKTAVNRKPGSPWDPKDGSKKPKLKRTMYQHGILLEPAYLSVKEIELMNQLKVGRYLNNWVKIYRRRDHGIDIDYPVKTASQRMKLVSDFGVTSLEDLLSKCIAEAANPKPETSADQD